MAKILQRTAAEAAVVPPWWLLPLPAVLAELLVRHPPALAKTAFPVDIQISLFYFFHGLRWCRGLFVSNCSGVNHYWHRWAQDSSWKKIRTDSRCHTGSFRVQEGVGVSGYTFVEDMLSESVVFDHQWVSRICEDLAKAPFSIIMQLMLSSAMMKAFRCIFPRSRWSLHSRSSEACGAHCGRVCHLLLFLRDGEGQGLVESRLIVYKIGQGVCGRSGAGRGAGMA